MYSAGYDSSRIAAREIEERNLLAAKRKQAGVSFPSPRKQEHLLIVRLNFEPSAIKDIRAARRGLRRLCNLFERLDKGIVKIDQLSEDGTLHRVSVSNFNFSATIGFGIGFFKKLQVRSELIPKNLYEMPSNIGLRDPVAYMLLQTDLIVQLGSSKDVVNRWVFESDAYGGEEKSGGQVQRYDARASPNAPIDQGDDINVHDIVTAVKDWAIVTDVHSGFQRLDGRNLMGFNDGISNVDRLRNEVVWTTKEDENEFLKDGTYMVFQKIEHDLEQWRRLSDDEKEKWVGRSKGTGLLLGTLSKSEDRKLASDLRSDDPLVSNPAIARLRRLLREQDEPNEKVFDTSNPNFRKIQAECPVWSHVRKANPRSKYTDKYVKIFRRGYLFMENAPNYRVSSGLLFICFQRNIKTGFEYIKKELLNNKNFPVPLIRKSFTREEIAERHRQGRFSETELRSLGPHERSLLGLDSKDHFAQAVSDSQDVDTQNTGREGLSGPSKLGINPKGEPLATITLGGGYYFVPPIPRRKIADIAEQFFS